MPMISYRCSVCGCDDEHFYHRVSDAPASLQCRSVSMIELEAPHIEHRIANSDGTETIEYETVETIPALSVCEGTLAQRESWMDASWSRPARPFEQLSVCVRVDSTGKPLENLPRDQSRYYFPGRNNEPTPAGMMRVDITSMAQYNKFAREVNDYERSRMSDHRAMHKEYFDARRKAMRDHTNARMGSSSSLSRMVSQLIRPRYDDKAHRRYSGPLDPKFHSHLLEFNQSNMQDYCDKDTRWKATRAR